LHDNKIDYVLTHTGGTQIYSHFGFNAKNDPWQKPLMEFLDWLEVNINFKKWYFGHMHEDFVYDDKHLGLYNYVTII
jgi:hypothetical protein